MSDSVSRDVVEAFYEAYSRRDLDTFGRFLAEDVEWHISGPIDILPHCGHHSGKAAVMKMIDRDIPDLLGNRRLIPSLTLVDGDRAAILCRVVGFEREGGRSISYRVAQFFRFRDDKVVECAAILDSYDAAEQVLGHPLAPHDALTTGENDLIAV